MLLVRAGRTAVHMRLGLTGAALVPPMASTGITAEINSQCFYLQRSVIPSGSDAGPLPPDADRLLSKYGQLFMAGHLGAATSHDEVREPLL